jgi:RHS repeat-associated protein/uncharacterized repeat protein (TIGR01451 family)
MRSGGFILSDRRRQSAPNRALILVLGLITALSGSLAPASALPASAAAAGQGADGTRVDEAPAPVFVSPTADAGDDQSVDEGTVVTLDATRSKSSNLVTRTYTTSADFAEGTSINLTDTPPDQLRLDDTTGAFGFIWVAASNRGTVVKIDTVTGTVLGEYWSAPQNRSKDPSRTTVDHNGNVWVGNRAETSAVGGVAKGSVTQIGLVENGQCVDRNGNGVIDTSTGLGNIKAWANAAPNPDTNGGVETALDECIINYVRTNGVAIRQVSVDADNHVWVGGAAQGGSPSWFDRLAPDGTIVRSINMRSPAATGESGVVVCCYGGLVDPAGILWSSSGSNNLVRLDPAQPNGSPNLISNINLGRTSYGLGIDPDGFLWQSNWTANTVQKISPLGAIVGTFGTAGGGNDRGVAVTAEGDVWVANSGGASVSRLRSNGTLITVIPVGSEPTGVAVDSAGKVWATNLGSSTASRINPATNTVDLTVSLGSGAGPYNYSDMTGSTLTGAPDDGTWSVVYDSGAADTPWAFLDWATQLPGDASFTVSVSSSANGVTFGPEVTVTDEEEISGLANGRYLRVTARFTRATTGESPVLFDLTVAHAGDRANTLAYQWRLVDIDGPPVFLSSATSATPSFVAPDDATYTFELTVTDSAGLSDTDEVTVTVNNLDPAVEAEIGSAFARGVTLVNASFTDPGWLDVHSATFDWGDGTAVEPMAVTAQGTGWGSFFGSHVYASAGNYHVIVTLTDDDGGSDAVDLGQVSVAEPVAVWANSKTAAKTFEWTGGGGSITGRVHSNREVKIAGTLPKSIIGPTEYVTTITVSGPHTVTPVQSTVQPIPVTYNLADYAPGGKVAVQVGTAYFNHTANCVKGLWDVGSQTLSVGVHYAPCSIKANGSSIAGRITLAATGSIELSGSRPAFEPFHDGLFLLAGASGSKAINVSASSSKFLGVIYAGAGEVSLSGSNSKFFCGIYGNTVSASGSNLILRGSNCGRPDSTISGPLLVPGLELSLAADQEETLPGGEIDYDLQVSNSGSLLIVPGLIGLENVDTAAATVTGITYAFEYFSVATGTWVPIASLADGKVALEAHANPSSGVTYPAADQIVGTVVGAGGFASWGYQALVELTPAQVNLLLDPARVDGFRNRVEFTLTPSSVQVRRLFTFGTDFIGAIRALSGDITHPSVTFLPPAGDLVVADDESHPALLVLTPGETVALDESFTVPVPAPRSASETDAGYLARLRVLDGSLLVGSSFALAQGGVGRLVAPLASATTIEQLPVVSLATTGPATMPAGTTAQFDLDLANQGSVTATGVALSASAAGSPLTVSGAPASLTAGELATAGTAYTAPTLNPPADVTVAGEVAWSDAAGNDYGPVGSEQTTQILTGATLSAILVDTLQTDVGGDGQASPGDTVRYTFTISNHGGQPLTGVSASATPDANSALVVGSVAAAGGTVGTGNGAGDTSVAVTYASIAGGSTASFTFDAVVDDPFPTGVSRIEVAGQVSATGFDPVASDDPALPGLADPTRTTVVVPAPNLIASLSGRLHLDPDGNGFPSAGDTLRYELVVASVGSLAVNGVGVTVPTPAGTSLVGGSVTTTIGTVVAGSAVNVDLGSLDFLDAATIRFDLLIANPVPTGQTAVTAQGTVASDELADLVTDDPHTIADGDATVITIGAGSGGGGGGTPGIPGPTIGTVSPAEGTVITEPIDIGTTLTPPAGETVTEWTVSYRLEGDSQGTELASGTGTTVAATIDPTILPNGAYVIEIRAEGSAGGVSVAETSIVVDGNLKLGRYLTTYQDLSVGVAGLPMQVLRTYDSFDKSTGDFGVGWNVQLADFHIATNGPLGEGGWRMFGCGPGLIFVPLCFDSSQPHYVTITWPDGRVELFDLTPAKGSTFLPGLTSAKFTARPRTTSTLEALDSSLYYSNGDLLGGFFGSGGIYDPQRFRLTDRVGFVYLLDVDEGLMSMTSPDGAILTVSDDGIVSSDGPSITFERDGQGRITSITAPDGAERTYGYDAAGDLRTATDFAGQIATFEYEPGHQLSASSGAGTPTQVLGYGDDGRLETIADSLGNVTTVQTDIDARTEILRSPDGRLNRILTYDVRGNLITRDDVFDSRTLRWLYEYDDGDRLDAVEDPEGHRATADYDDEGNLIKTVDATGVITEFTFNDQNRPTGIKVAGIATFVATYDARGRLETSGRPDSPKTRIVYGTDGKVASVTPPEGPNLTYTYDANGYVASLDSPLGTIGYVNDANGRVLEITDPLTRTTRYEYDDNGQLTAIVDPLDRRQSWTYTARGEVETMTDKSARTTTFIYNTAGQLIERRDRSGTSITFSYTPNGLIDTRTTPDGVTTFEYDPLDRLTQVTNRDAVVELGWDDANTLVRQTSRGIGASDQPEVTILSEADGTGRPMEISSLGEATQYAYDTAGRLDTITTAPTQVFDYDYDPIGRPSSLARPNGVTDTFTFTPGGRLDVRSSTHASQVIDSIDNGYDASGLRGSLTDADGARTFGYDGIGRLESVDHPVGAPVADESYGYDAVGNRLSNGALYNTADRILEDQVFRYGFDLEGRLISKVVKATNAETRYWWDAEGQLTAITHPNGAQTTFRYDGLGRRVEVDDRGNVSRFVYNGPSVRHAFDGSNALTSTYVTSLNPDDILSVESGGDIAYPIRDPLGTATVITDESGAAIEHHRYDAYGLPVNGTPDAPMPGAWAGLTADPTGLYFARARYYDPTSGRFLSEDPIPEANLYQYALDNPVNLVDPTGQTAMVEYQANTQDDAAQACSASRSIVPLLDWIQLMVDLVDIFTAPGTAVFYSGGNSADAAQKFARQSGKFTIDMTPGGKWLTDYGDLRNIFDPKTSNSIWSRISQRFAQNASGEVFVFLDNPRADGVWNTVEKEALEKNPRVTKITYNPKSPCG